MLFLCQFHIRCLFDINHVHFICRKFSFSVFGKLVTILFLSFLLFYLCRLFQDQANLFLHIYLSHQRILLSQFQAEKSLPYFF